MTSSLTGFGAENQLAGKSPNNKKHLSPEEKFEIKRVKDENNRLYGKILDMENSL